MTPDSEKRIFEKVWFKITATVGSIITIIGVTIYVIDFINEPSLKNSQEIAAIQTDLAVIKTLLISVPKLIDDMSAAKESLARLEGALGTDKRARFISSSTAGVIQNHE